MKTLRGAALIAAMVLTALPSAAIGDELPTTPAETITVTPTPPEETTGETPPADETTGETPPADETTGETPPADETTGETPPADETTEETPPVDETPAYEESKGPRVMVVGDSISGKARYNERGTDGRIKAWWARLGFTDVNVDAIAGSGMLNLGAKSIDQPEEVTPALDRPGAECFLNTSYSDRLWKVDVQSTDILIVEGGRNDFKRCEDGKVHTATAARAEKAIKAYMSALRAKVDQADSVLTPDKVYVMSPWGTRFSSERSDVAPLVEKYARLNGFTWIMLPALAETYTVDGTHPNVRGSRMLAESVLANSDIDGSAPRRGVSTRCSGLKACVATGHASASSHDAIDHSYWSQPAGVRNYIAYRLTHNGRVTRRPAYATMPSTWKDAALRGGHLAASTPKVGSVAWWPEGVLGEDGHLAYVESVNEDATTVTVSEIVGSGTYRRMTYYASSFPRAFLRFYKSGGTPFGEQSSAGSTAHHSLTVKGYASDADAYRTGVRVTVTVWQGSSKHSFEIGRHEFEFSKTFTGGGLRSGDAVVRAWVHNVPGSKGASTGYLGAKKVAIQ